MWLATQYVEVMFMGFEILFESCSYIGIIVLPATSKKQDICITFLELVIQIFHEFYGLVGFCDSAQIRDSTKFLFYKGFNHLQKESVSHSGLSAKVFDIYSHSVSTILFKKTQFKKKGRKRNIKPFCDMLYTKHAHILSRIFSV